MCGSGSRKLLNTDPVRIRIRNTVSSEISFCFSLLAIAYNFFLKTGFLTLFNLVPKRPNSGNGYKKMRSGAGASLFLLNCLLKAVFRIRRIRINSLDPVPYCFCLNPDPYQSSSWIRIRYEFFNILDPDRYQNYTDPPHWLQLSMPLHLVILNLLCPLCRYCQMCEKQCRDENGFKCHMTSESHQRQLLLFGENPGKYLSTYSKDFEKV